MTLLAHMFIVSLSSQLCANLGTFETFKFSLQQHLQLKLNVAVSKGAEVSAFLLIFAPLSFQKYMLLLTKSL